MLQTKILKSILLLVLLGFIWGSGYSLAKFAMTNGVPPLGYAFWQSLGPALFLTILCFASKQHKQLHRSNWLYFIICGLIGIAIPNTNMYFIAQHIPAGSLAVLVNTVPVIIYPLALISGLEKPDKWRFLALVIGVTGIILIINPKALSLGSNWNLLALLSPLAFAGCSIYIAKRQPIKMNTLQAATGMLIAASIILTPLVFQQQAFYPLTSPYTLVKKIVLLEIVLSSLGYLIFFSLIRIAGPVFYSLTGGIVSLTGLFWGYLIFGEKSSKLHLLATACIILSIFLISWRQAKIQGVKVEND